MNVLGGKL